MFLAPCWIGSMKSFFNLSKIQGVFFTGPFLNFIKFYDFQPITLILDLKIDYNMCAA